MNRSKNTKSIRIRQKDYDIIRLHAFMQHCPKVQVVNEIFALGIKEYEKRNHKKNK